MKYLALGDSYTVGEGIDVAERWPDVLAARLRAAGVPVEAPRVIATTGWTTDELAAAIDAEEPIGRHDFVSLLIGVNNQYRGRSVAEYRGEFGDLLRRAIRYAGGDASRVLVLSIPDWGVTPFARAQQRDAAQVAREIDAYNAAAREACERAGVAFVDITTASRDGGGAAAMLVEDALHPSGAMHARWVDAAFPVARDLLGTG